MTSSTNPDPILDEIRHIRDQFAERHHNDVASFFAEVRKHQQQSGREILPPPSKPPSRHGASDETAA